MAKISLSPLVVDIRGKQKDTVFSKWRGLNYIRSRVTPGNPRTPDQIGLREAFAVCVILWSELPTAIKANWNEYASGKSFSGYNAFMKDNITRQLNGTGLVITKKTIDPPIIAFSATPGEGPETIDIGWTNPDPDTVGIMNILIRVKGSEEWEQHLTTGDLQHDIEAVMLEHCGEVYEVYGWIDYQEDDQSVGLSASSSSEVTPACP